VNNSNQPPVSVILCGDAQATNAWYPVFLADARFAVQSMVPNVAGLRAMLEHGGAEAVILQDSVCPPNELIALVGQIPTNAYVALTRPNEELNRQLKEQPTVRYVFAPGFRMAEALGTIHAEAVAKRSQAPVIASDWQAKATQRTTLPQSVRIVSVWNQCGGAGCSTVASNLAWESARRGYQTLLICLASPDSGPLLFNNGDLMINMSAWVSNPTPGALNSAIQKVGPLALLSGFPDYVSQSQALGAGPDSNNYLGKLFGQAIMMGYGSIVIDVQHSMMEVVALENSNTLVLVARPTISDAYCSHRAFHLVRKTMAGKHAINPRTSVFVALNRVRKASMGAREWIGNVRDLEREPPSVPFPDVETQIPDDPEVEFAQSRGELPLLMVESFAKPLVDLADRLWGEKKTYQDTSGKRVNIGGWITGRVK
jgi:arsenite-transporting ATPase